MFTVMYGNEPIRLAQLVDQLTGAVHLPTKDSCR